MLGNGSNRAQTAKYAQKNMTALQRSQQAKTAPGTKRVPHNYGNQTVNDDGNRAGREEHNTSGLQLSYAEILSQSKDGPTMVIEENVVELNSNRQISDVA